MKLNQLSENDYHYHGTEVTADNFEQIKQEMVAKIEAELGPDAHPDLKEAMLAAQTPDQLAAIMVSAMGAR